MSDIASTGFGPVDGALSASRSGIASTESQLAEEFNAAIERFSFRSNSLTGQLGQPDVNGVDRVDITRSNLQSDINAMRIDPKVEEAGDADSIQTGLTQLKEVMDYAAEMHLFVRTSTQISSAMNTLTKGQ